MYMLQIKRLDQLTALELVKASRALSWSSLYPVLDAMAKVTCFGPCVDHELTVLHMLNAFEALDLLLGEAPLTLLQRSVEYLFVGMNTCSNLLSHDPAEGPPALLLASRKCANTLAMSWLQGCKHACGHFGNRSPSAGCLSNGVCMSNMLHEKIQ